jgi:hypothetical protein
MGQSILGLGCPRQLQYEVQYGNVLEVSSDEHIFTFNLQLEGMQVHHSAGTDSAQYLTGSLQGQALRAAGEWRLGKPTDEQLLASSFELAPLMLESLPCEIPLSSSDAAGLAGDGHFVMKYVP